jgi:hypothetical protein
MGFASGRIDELTGGSSPSGTVSKFGDPGQSKTFPIGDNAIVVPPLLWCYFAALT